MKDLYQDLPRLKVELSFTIILITLITIIIFLIFPIYLLNDNQIDLSQSINTFENSIKTTDTNHIIIIVGLIIFLLSIGLIFYLLMENFYQKRVSNIKLKKTH